MLRKWFQAFVLSTFSIIPSSTAAVAMDFNGGYVTGSYAAFSDRSGVRKAGIQAGAEYRLTDRYGLQIDASTFQFDQAGTSSYNVAVHGFRHLNETLTVGAFIGTERLSNQNAGYYGIEAVIDTGRFSAEAYAADFVKRDSRSAAKFGLSTTMSVTDRLDLGLNFARFEISDARDVARGSISARYRVSERASIQAEYGRVELGTPFGNLDDRFVSLGVTIHFGETGRTTFGQRGLSTLLPGG